MLFLRFKRYSRKSFCYQDQYYLQAIVLCSVILCHYLILPHFLDNDYLAEGIVYCNCIVYCVLTRWLALLVVCWEANSDYTKLTKDYAFHCASIVHIMITLPKLSQEKKRQGRKGSIIVFAAECSVRIQHRTSGLERYTTFDNPIYLDKPQHCLFNYTSLEISCALGCSNYLKNTKQTSSEGPASVARLVGSCLFSQRRAFVRNVEVCFVFFR